MSIQDMTRFVGILTLDHRKLAKFLPKDADGNHLRVDWEGQPQEGVDVNVESRREMIDAFYPELEPMLEKATLQTGNMERIYAYIFDTAPRPVPDFDGGG